MTGPLARWQLHRLRRGFGTNWQIQHDRQDKFSAALWPPPQDIEQAGTAAQLEAKLLERETEMFFGRGPSS